MTSSLRSLITLLLFVTTSALAQGQTVLFDFEGGFNNLLDFGTGTLGVDIGTGGSGEGLVADCGILGNTCAAHDMNFTPTSTAANAFGFGDIGPFFAPTSIDLSPYIGYSIDARFIRTGIADFHNPPPLGLPPREDFTGLSPIEFGVQWDPNDGCGGSSNACSDLYEAPVMLTENFQTFTVMFAGLGIPGTAPANLQNVQIKMLMRSGDQDPDGTTRLDSADFNADGSVTGADFMLWQRHVGETDPQGGIPRFDHGNANLGTFGVENQGTINGADLAIWEAQFGLPGNPIGDWSDGVGRLEYDNIIGILPPVMAGASAVPEPSSCRLILCCSCLLACRGRDIRKGVE